MSTLAHTSFMNSWQCGWQLLVKRRVENFTGDLRTSQRMYTQAQMNIVTRKLCPRKVATALHELARLPMSMSSSVYPGCDQSITHVARVLDLASSIDACACENESQ